MSRIEEAIQRLPEDRAAIARARLRLAYRIIGKAVDDLEQAGPEESVRSAALALCELASAAEWSLEQVTQAVTDSWLLGCTVTYEAFSDELARRSIQ